jgi:Activator of Hsp90 ATPase homolog 1-like protein
MTSTTRAGDRILGSLRAAEGKGIVRMEDRFDTEVDEVWSALTDPRRLASWLGEVEGDLRLGGEFRARFFASGWEGTGRVDACEPPQRLLVLTKHANASEEQSIEATLTADGDQTILVWGNGGCRSTCSPPTGPAFRFMSKISPPTWPGAGAATRRPGSTNSSPPIKTWPPTSASSYP